MPRDSVQPNCDHDDAEEIGRISRSAGLQRTAEERYCNVGSGIVTLYVQVLARF